MSVANLYYCQPMLGLIARAFNVSGAAAGQVVTVTQLGYAAGLLLLIPLGDKVDRRQLMVWQSAGMVLALCAAALAPSLPALLCASWVIGMGATVAQHAVPLAAEMADEANRGRTVGVVMSGLLAGILLARVLSGVVGDVAGWRAMYALGAVITIAIAVVLARTLPRREPGGRGSYVALLASLARLALAHPTLRRAAITQALVFGAFSAFWATLALFLESMPGHLGSAAAGAYGVIGLAGVAIAPWAGRLADRYGPRRVVQAGLALVLSGMTVLGAWPTLLGLAAAVVLLDSGVQFAMISHQTLILALDPQARGRVNTVFMVTLFLGASAGSFAGGMAWHHFGWPGVVGVGASMTLMAVVAHIVRPPSPEPPAAGTIS